MDQKDSRQLRFLIFVTLFLLVIGFYLGVLFNTQIVHHEEYLAQSVHSITREESIKASRGIITDRAGRTMVSNGSRYDLTFDASLLKSKEEQNQAILRLIQLCQSCGKSWVDNLPLSSGQPVSFSVDQISKIQKGRFMTYLESLDETRELLGTYLMEHPSLAPEPEKEETIEEQIPIIGEEAEEISEESEPATPITEEILLDRFPSSTLSNQFLIDAGITPEQLYSLMLREFDLDTTVFSPQEKRQIMGVRYELALRKLDNYNDYILVEDIDTTMISIITDGNYSGAKVTTTAVRQYNTPYAAHILGTVTRINRDDMERLQGKGYNGNDWIGRSGVEAAFEPYLKGTDGLRVVSVNSQGKITGEYYDQEPCPGNTVELTIDLDLQKTVEDALADTIAKMNRKDGRNDRGAGAAVVKVGTGEVLALASYPTYDLATFHENYSNLEKNPATPMNNRATQGTYAPGSTLKPLTAVAALEEGVTTPTEELFDTGVWYYPGDPTHAHANCWYSAGHGRVNVTKAITVSCNYYFAEMGYRLGEERLNKYLTGFGLGDHTGLEIGDRTGRRPSNAEGQNQTPWAAFGQSNQLYTPIQLANYIATLVSGGKHYSAHLLKSVKAYDNSETIALGDSNLLNTVEIKDSTLQIVKQGMHNLTLPGGSLAGYFNSCIVSAGAKTGTAQIRKDVLNNGVFVCFAPYENPEIALAMVIEKGKAGAALASTAVTILNSYFSTEEIGSVILGEDVLLP